MSSEALSALAARLGGSFTPGLKSSILSVPPEKIPDACRGVSSLPGLYHLSTITAFDQGDSMAILYHFWEGRRFVQVRTAVPKPAPRLPSISDLIPSATLYEGEIQDLLGIAFEGNPFLGKRLLLPDDYPAEAPPPLRKDADPKEIRRMMKLE